MGLRALAETQLVSEHLFVAGNHLKPEMVSSIRNVLYSLNKSEAGKGLLAGIRKDADALVPVKDANYDNLRNILEFLKKHGVE